MNPYVEQREKQDEFLADLLPRRPDLWATRAKGGSDTHLVDRKTQKALCGKRKPKPSEGSSHAGRAGWAGEVGRRLCSPCFRALENGKQVVEDAVPITRRLMAGLISGGPCSECGEETPQDGICRRPHDSAPTTFGASLLPSNRVGVDSDDRRPS